MQESSPKKKINRKNLIIQLVFILIFALIVMSSIFSARHNLDAQGMSSGFGFLERATGWSYSFSLIENSIDDPYRQTLFIGFLNTLFLGTVSIFLATILGFAVGTARDARNIAVQGSATVFIQFFRNIPLILQLVFWYAMLIHMPGPKQSMSFFDVAFLSNRGMMLPGLNLPGGSSLFILVFAILTAWVVTKLKYNTVIKMLGWLGINLALIVLISILFAADDTPVLSIPELKGLRFRGGIQVPIELIAMMIAIVLYGAAYIAEVVKGGLRGVPKGLIEAGKALGLNEGSIWLRIKLPMALRTIIPPLGNQWVFLMKATTIGVAIGFSDLFMIISTSITQSGQTLELIAILMGAFLLINFTIARLVGWLNNRMQLKAN